MDPTDLDQLGATWQHPVDYLEPKDEKSRFEHLCKFADFMNCIDEWVWSADNGKVGWLQVAYAIGLERANSSMSTRAAQLGCERATISNGAVAFCKANDLPPGFAMRSEAARQAYRERRVRQLKQNEKNEHRDTGNNTTGG